MSEVGFKVDPYCPKKKSISPAAFPYTPSIGVPQPQRAASLYTDHVLSTHLLDVPAIIFPLFATTSDPEATMRPKTLAICALLLMHASHSLAQSALDPCQLHPRQRHNCVPNCKYLNDNINKRAGPGVPPRSTIFCLLL